MKQQNLNFFIGGEDSNFDKPIKMNDINSIEKLEKIILKYLNLTNSNLMNFLLKNCKIDQHLIGLKNFIFLSEGNFIQHLMDSLK